jgi:hypothetical protein
MEIDVAREWGPGLRTERLRSQSWRKPSADGAERVRWWVAVGLAEIDELAVACIGGAPLWICGLCSSGRRARTASARAQESDVDIFETRNREYSRKAAVLRFEVDTRRFQASSPVGRVGPDVKESTALYTLGECASSAYVRRGMLCNLMRERWFSGQRVDLAATEPHEGIRGTGSVFYDST